jgi:DNA-binding NtrC family response regulator
VTTAVSPPPRVLVVDDDPDQLDYAAHLLGGQGFQTVATRDGEEALTELARRSFDALLTDLELPGTDGFALMARAADVDPDLPAIAVTGHVDVEHAVRALRAGAYDFLTKPLDAERLRAVVGRAVEHVRLRREVHRLRGVMDRDRRFERLVGSSPAMKRVYETVQRVAATTVSVLVAGESGTGKELVARALHARSEVADGPFVAINCAAVPAQLLESELFGHAKGAFTGAGKAREGLFRAAEGGTLFLDEVGELPLEMQPKLLRALQERRVRPVGGDAEVPFDARVLSATHRDLTEAMRDGSFREDLYYRLHVVRIDLPPLRERGTDVVELARLFVERHAERHGRPVRGLAEGVEGVLLGHDWPGNVRELENAMERAVALSRFDHVTVADLPPALRRVRRRAPALDEGPVDQLPTLAELEREHVQRVLAGTEGNKARAARILGIDRRTLYRKLAHLDREAS